MKGKEKKQVLTECEAFINARLSSYFILFKTLYMKKILLNLIVLIKIARWR